MSPRRFPPTFAAILAAVGLVSVAPACVTVSTGGARTATQSAPPTESEDSSQSAPSAESARPPLSAGSRARTASRASRTCPDDLSLDRAARAIDTREHPTLPEAVRKSRTWAPGHRKVPGKDFGISADDAVSRVLAVESRDPSIVPAGFRDALRASPRDPVLRRRMAQCEALHAATRRRAAQDGAIAFLLGDVSGLEFAESVARDAGVRLVSQDLSPDEELFWIAGKDDLEIEDAITRGLYARRASVRPAALTAWGKLFLHRCGTMPCFLRPAEGSTPFDERITLVDWDIRDGGNDNIHGDDGKAREQAEQECHSKTGAYSLEECRQSCDVQGRAAGTECYVRCAAFCKRHE